MGTLAEGVGECADPAVPDGPTNTKPAKTIHKPSPSSAPAEQPQQVCTTPLLYNDYDLFLKELDAIKSAARDDALLLDQLPKLVVIGEESVGKSALLQCLTNVMFPTDVNTCTRVPIWVECRRTPEISCQILNTDDGAYQKVDPNEELAKAIRADQNRILEQEGADRSQTAVAVRRCGRDQMDITVVDLPGVEHRGAAAAVVGADPPCSAETEKQDVTEVKATDALVEKYYSNPLTVALIVHDVNTTYDNYTIRSYIEKHDPQGMRTLHVVTKCDTVRTDVKAHVARTLMDQRTPTHAVVCAPHGGRYCAAFEGKHFESYATLESNIRDVYTGVLALRRRLVRMFVGTLKLCIPQLSIRYNNFRKQYDADLKCVGRVVRDAAGVRALAIDILREDGKSRIEKELTDLCATFQNNVNTVGIECVQQTPVPKKEYAEVSELVLPIIYTNQVFRVSQYTPSFDQGDQGFSRCLYRIVNDLWGVMLADLQSKIYCKFLDGAFLTELLIAPEFPDVLKEYIKHRWAIAWRRATDNFGEEIEKWKEFNSHFSERNANFRNESRPAFTDEFRRKFVSTFRHQPTSNQNSMLSLLDSVLAASPNPPIVGDATVLYKAAVSCYRSKSVVLESMVVGYTRKCLLEEFTKWVDEFRNDVTILDCCKEHPERALRRKTIVGQIDILDACLERLSVLSTT